MNESEVLEEIRGVVPDPLQVLRVLVDGYSKFQNLADLWKLPPVVRDYLRGHMALELAGVAGVHAFHVREFVESGHVVFLEDNAIDDPGLFKLYPNSHGFIPQPLGVALEDSSNGRVLVGCRPGDVWLAQHERVERGDIGRVLYPVGEGTVACSRRYFLGGPDIHPTSKSLTVGVLTFLYPPKMLFNPQR